MMRSTKLCCASAILFAGLAVIFVGFAHQRAAEAAAQCVADGGSETACSKPTSGPFWDAVIAFGIAGFLATGVAYELGRRESRPPRR